LLIADLAAIEQLKEKDPDAVNNCSSAAGLSLGEYPALVHAGALTFEEAMRLVRIRATAMQEVSILRFPLVCWWR
jgi:[acyl-carrier-protein] S-malonyltransferase